MTLSFLARAPYTPPVLPPTLQSFIGHLPASLNMSPGFLHDGTTQFGNAQDFTQWDGNTGLIIGSGQSFDGQPCQKLIATAIGGNHMALSNQRACSVPNTPHTMRVALVAKPAGYSRLVSQFNSNFGPAGSVGFDFAGGNTNYGNSFTNATLVGGAAHMVALTGGWWLGYYDYFPSGASTYDGSTHPQTAWVFLDNGSGTAANSTSFTGDGTSGVLVLLASQLPTVLWTQTWNQTYNNDFPDLSKIDVNNSKNPGFDWYPSAVWPQTVYTTFGWAPGFDPPSGVPPTAPSIITQPAASIMRLWNPNTVTGPNFGFTGQLFSIVDDGAGGYHGTGVYTGPLITDQFASFSGGNVVVSGAPSFPRTFTQSQFSQFISGDGCTWYTMPLGAVISASNPANTLNPLNQYTIDEFDMGGSSSQHGNMGQGSQILPHWNPASVTSGQVGPIGQNDVNLFTEDFFVRQTSVWLPCYCDPNALGYGLIMAFGNGGMGNCVFSMGSGQFAVAAYFRSARSGQADFQPQFSITACTDKTTVTNPGFDGVGIPPGGQRFDIDWMRVYNTSQLSLNFWDPFDADANLVFDVTSLVVTKTSGTGWGSVRGSGIGKNAGQWYWEITLAGGTLASTTSAMLGLCNRTATMSGDFPGQTAKGAGVQYNTALNTNVNGVTGLTASVVTWTAGDVIGFLFDGDAGHVYIHKNGTYINGNPGSGNGVWSGLTNADLWYPAVAINTPGVGTTLTANFGEKAFAFAIPSGAAAWVLP